MKHVRLTLDADGRESEIADMYDLLANADFVHTAKTLHWNYSGDRIGIMHYVEGDPDAYRDAVDSMPEITEYEVTRDDAEHFYSYQLCDVPQPARQLFGTLTRGELVVVPPLEYAPDGSVSVSLIGTSAEVQAAVDGVPEPVEVTIDEITGLGQATNSVDAVLSERQREAVEAALELGYYDVPREASHEAVAERMDCAPSTAAEHLRKAESRAFRSLFG